MNLAVPLSTSILIEKTGMEHPTFIVIKNFFYIKDIELLDYIWFVDKRSPYQLQ